MRRARLVIVGAGIVGCSAAFHLTQKGWQDIVVLDQGPLFHTGGSTSHAPGLVFQTSPSKTMTELAKRTVSLLSRLFLDGQPCFYPVGSMEVAGTPERLDELKRRLGFGMSWGLHGELLGPDEAARRLPLLDLTKIYGALYVHGDGIAKAVRAAEAMARDATARGARFKGGIEVTGIEIAHGRVRGVDTSDGRIATDQVLVCAGIWGPQVGRMAGIPIPLIPCQHLYATTAPISELREQSREVAHPILRHQDKSMYFRQHADYYGIGSYRHEPLLLDPDAVPRRGTTAAAPAVMPFTPEHFDAAHAAAVELLPALRGVALTHAINGIFSFTPDGFPLIGESADVKGLWVAEAVWITHAGGVGSAVAEWMVDGAPGVDLRECDLNRFPAHATTASYVRARAAQQYREVYDIIHPMQQTGPPRDLRVSPFHRRLKDLGAVFSETAGWERPMWFQSNEKLTGSADTPTRSGWEAFCWSPIQALEHRAARTAVAMVDLTPFTKIEVTGPGALSFLDRICANRIGSVGAVTYTPMLDQNGGIVCDLTVTRLADDRFFLVTGAGSGVHDLAWIRRYLPTDGAAEVTDVTSTYCAIGLWGPRARDVLRASGAPELPTASFPYLTAQPVDIAATPCLALRVSYVGELGWEIYTRTEYGLRLWDRLWEAGVAHGIAPVGTGAFDSLRLEKGYRLWGADIHTEYNPYEAGLGFAVKLDKSEFLGREALLRIKQGRPNRKLCCLRLSDASAVVMGKEPILDGRRSIGYVTSANYGYTVGAGIAYGYLPRSHSPPGTAVEIQYFGRRYGATVSSEPLHDPGGLRLRQ